MKLGRYVLTIVLFFIFSYYFNSIQLSEDVTVRENDTYAVFYEKMSFFDSLMFKIYLRLHYHKAPTIHPWLYRSEKKLSYSQFLDFISKKPQIISINVTLLEWWSSYDYDSYLVKRGLIATWDYKSLIVDNEFIQELRKTYSFLPSDIVSLEWYLYPDTYRIDVNKPNIERQLITMQLDNFYNKVRWPDPALFTQFSKKLRNDGFDFSLSPYGIIKLASIIENEEKVKENKRTIAGLFLNRLNLWMQLWADVTLCYGKWVTYSVCTPKFIVDHLYDKWNLYNTRTNSWLTPTPISNPSVETIAAVLSYDKTPYLYYLHDSKWWIHYGTTLEEHNINKSRYIP